MPVVRRTARHLFAIAAGAALVSAARPAMAFASTVNTYGSLDEMPPYVRAIFIGVLVLVPLIIAITAWAVFRQRKVDTATVESMLEGVRGIVESAEVPAGDPFAQILADDPGFNEELFKGRVNEMFIAIKYAWSARDMKPVRRFLSDEQFRAADIKVQADYVAKGRINRLEDIMITRIAPVEVERQGSFDSVKVMIEGTVTPSTVDENTGKLINERILGDGTTQRRFKEAWTFLRKTGVRSKSDATIRKCPNCGAPVSGGDYEDCAYCAAKLNDPSLDWVVVHIEHFG